MFEPRHFHVWLANYANDRGKIDLAWIGSSFKLQMTIGPRQIAIPNARQVLGPYCVLVGFASEQPNIFGRHILWRYWNNKHAYRI